MKLIIIVNIQIDDKTAPIIIKTKANCSFPFLEYRITPQAEKATLAIIMIHSRI
jgi:hypothetical protein